MKWIDKLLAGSVETKNYLSAVSDKGIFDLTTTAAAATSHQFLTNCGTHDFLIPEETHSFHEDPLLYSVEHGELQPISSPFMVPGIYKKITTLPSNVSKTNGAAVAASNVFLSDSETSGRIINAHEFQNLYINDCSQPVECEVQFPRVQPRIPSAPKQTECTAKVTIAESNESEVQQLDALSKLAYNIYQLSQEDHIVIDRKRNEIVRTEYGTNQKTIYRFPAAETLNLKPPDKSVANNLNNSSINKEQNEQRVKLKIGRPRKNCSEGSIVNNQYQKLSKARLNDSNKSNVVDNELQKQTPQLRTRSGRVVKLVKPVLLTPTPQVATQTNAANAATEMSTELLRNFLTELKDADYRCNKPKSPILVAEQTSPLKETELKSPLASSSPTKRRVPPESICPTCKKIFLGRRLQRHFTQHPDHMQLPTTLPSLPPNEPLTLEHFTSVQEDMTLFRFLIAKLQKASHLNEDQRAELFLNEINDLVEQLQLRSSRLIRNTSGLHFVTARTARILGIPEGQYALDMSAIEAPLQPEQQFEQIHSLTMPSSVTCTNARNLDYTNLSVSLDNTLTDEAAQKLNLSAGGKLLPPSEESLLRAVDDFVHDGMAKLSNTNLHLHAPACRRRSVDESAVVGTLVPHYDHVSDNAVEAVTLKETTNATQQTTPMLDLAVDFFQFNNN